MQAEFQKTGGRGRAGRQTNMGGRGDTGGRTEGRGRDDTGGGVQGRGGRTPGRGRSQGRYHNWVLRDQFDNLSNEEYQTLIRERVTRGELQAHHADTDAANPTVFTMGNSISIPHGDAPNPSSPDASSTVTGVPPYPTPLLHPALIRWPLRHQNHHSPAPLHPLQWIWDLTPYFAN